MACFVFFFSPIFGAGVFAVLSLFFFLRVGASAEWGKLLVGSSVWRFFNPYGGFVVLVLRSTGTCESRRFVREQRPIRIVRVPADARTGDGMPQTIELTAQGEQTYKLVMTLLEAVPLDP